MICIETSKSEKPRRRYSFPEMKFSQVFRDRFFTLFFPRREWRLTVEFDMDRFSGAAQWACKHDIKGGQNIA